MQYTLYYDRVRSALTNRDYSFIRDNDGSSKRQAIATLEADDQKIVDAANDRAMKTIGRTLSPKEIRTGKWLPDNRDLRQRVAEDGKTIQKDFDPDTNPFVSHIETLRAQLPHDKSGAVAKRLALHEAKAQEWEQQRSEQREREAKLNNPDVKYWLADAQAALALLSIDSNASQEHIERAAMLRNRLKETGDVDAYKRDMAQLDAEREKSREAKAAALDEQAKALRSEAKQIRACDAAGLCPV